MAGSVLITVLSGFVLGLAATALSVIVQAVVVAEVAHAVLAERLTLKALWQRVKPVAWRLIGYTLLLTLGLLVLFALVGAAIFALAFSVPGDRDRIDDPGRARRHPADAVAVDEARAGSLGAGAGAHDHRRSGGAFLGAASRQVLAGARASSSSSR